MMAAWLGVIRPSIVRQTSRVSHSSYSMADAAAMHIYYV